MIPIVSVSPGRPVSQLFVLTKSESTAPVKNVSADTTPISRKLIANATICFFILLLPFLFFIHTMDGLLVPSEIDR